jgi:hypothetical protein
MPAIASLEDLRAAQEEGLSIYAMLYLSSKAETTATEDALCACAPERFGAQVRYAIFRQATSSFAGSA